MNNSYQYYMTDQKANTQQFQSNAPPMQNLTKNNDMDPSKQKRTRARGEALDVLKAEFLKNTNPSSKRRKVLSEVTGLSEKKIRIWFQNRRAKMRKTDKSNLNTGHDSASGDQNSIIGNKKNSTSPIFLAFDTIPLTSNNNYYFIDVCSITVGSWNRMKSGSLKSKNPNELILSSVSNLTNLSPISINNLMLDKTDLIALISKKNYEINYFFSAIANNTKILFRIFYPINTITNCSLVLETDDIISNQKSTKTNKDDLKLGELKISLSRSPNFAVFFLEQSNSDNLNANQWSICEDFSEGRQVSDAFIGGSNIPHVLKGLQDSLRFINSLILDYNCTNVNVNQQPTLNSFPNQQQHLLYPQPQQQQQQKQYIQQPLVSRSPMQLNGYNQPQLQQQYQPSYLNPRNQNFFFDNNDTSSMLTNNVQELNNYQTMMDPNIGISDLSENQLNMNLQQTQPVQTQTQQQQQQQQQYDFANPIPIVATAATNTTTATTAAVNNTNNNTKNNNNTSNNNMLMNTPEYFRTTSDMHMNINYNNNSNSHDNNVINRWL
ncbi:hypothetical protein TPHA_0C03620 [Tetrapisispora phaffii CBS 4417]|uniref:Homeobox domain-containing protein n=1 Tax=Tetrapisispora phaffii (strain ATCC 24235 / CBS 4417 / NBRC 1672 / NRRL Y-8282 / UCD 70-5) TaxID=1071381 RepID=G8BQK2_TETPH|nr:hypothetical protein TPHA_0C03620 [Tetrapisispora phaffii CBS 4417]CCE62514.1 hypothetical protein TPHA_0C03620 [Tetrapisispora phaffii CBS 4417]